MCHSNSFYSNYYPGSSWDGKIPFREQFRQWQHRSTQMCEPGAGEEGRWLWEGSPKAQPWVPGGREGSLSVWTDGSSQRSLCAARRATARLRRGRKAERVTQMHPTGRASVTGAGSLAWNSDSVSWSRVSSDRRRQQLWEGTQVHVVSVAGAGGSASCAAPLSPRDKRVRWRPESRTNTVINLSYISSTLQLILNTMQHNNWHKHERL